LLPVLLPLHPSPSSQPPPQTQTQSHPTQSHPTQSNQPSPQEFAKRAAAVCGKDVAEVAKSYALAAAHAPYFCLDLSFCHTVLTQGFDLAEGDQLTLVKQVKYNGQVRLAGRLVGWVVGWVGWSEGGC
jgi:hypothetical protein